MQLEEELTWREEKVCPASHLAQLGGREEREREREREREMKIERTQNQCHIQDRHVIRNFKTNLDQQELISVELFCLLDPLQKDLY